jgi:hypothetical protein
VLAHRDASHALAIMLGGARPVASEPVLLDGEHTGRVYLQRSISPAAALTLQGRALPLAASHGRQISTLRRR